jgi:hypothetical protein
MQLAMDGNASSTMGIDTCVKQFCQIEHVASDSDVSHRVIPDLSGDLT